MTGLPGVPCGMTQASYDLARLRRNGLIIRRPHANTYALTSDGLAFAIFYTKVCDRVLRHCSLLASLRQHPNSGPPCDKSNTSSPSALQQPGCPRQPVKLSSTV
jgi:hypothetical protein